MALRQYAVVNGLPQAAAVLESERCVCEVDPLMKQFVDATPASLSEVDPVPKWGKFMSAFGEGVAHALSYLMRFPVCSGCPITIRARPW